MAGERLFWYSIVRHLEEKYSSHPSTWEKEYICHHILADIKETVEKACMADASKAELCGFKKASDIRLWEPTYLTFRRIIITRESIGSSRTRNIYAIFVGYESESDFCTKNSIRNNESFDTEKQELKLYREDFGVLAHNKNKLSQCLRLLERNEIEQIFRLFESIDSLEHGTTILLRRRFNELKQKKVARIISESEAGVQNNQLAYDLLTFIKDSIIELEG